MGYEQLYIALKDHKELQGCQWYGPIKKFLRATPNNCVDIDEIDENAIDENDMDRIVSILPDRIGNGFVCAGPNKGKTKDTIFELMNELLPEGERAPTAFETETDGPPHPLYREYYDESGGVHQLPQNCETAGSILAKCYKTIPPPIVQVVVEQLELYNLHLMGPMPHNMPIWRRPEIYDDDEEDTLMDAEYDPQPCDEEEGCPEEQVDKTATMEVTMQPPHTSTLTPVYGPELPQLAIMQNERNKRHRLLKSLALLAQCADVAERAECSYDRCHWRCQLRDIFYHRRNSLMKTEFITVFRMSPHAMEELRNKLYPYLKPRLSEANIVGRQNSNRRPLTVDEKVALGCMGAGGCTLGGLMWGFGVGHTCVEKTLFDFFQAVVLSGVGRIEFPGTEAELRKMADQFLQNECNLPSLFIGHLAAGDGYAVRIRMPGRHECDNPMSYRNRKGFASINVQALADATPKCRLLQAETPGSSHDRSAWQLIDFAQKWENEIRIKYHGTERYYYISFDDAYGCGATYLGPWVGTGLATRAPFKDAFNYYLNKGYHNCIERLWGQVYQRFGILWRPLLFPLRRCPIVITALFSLHNFLKEVGDDDDDVSHSPAVNTGPGQHRENEPFRSLQEPDGYDHNLHPQHECWLEEVAVPRVRRGQCPIREHITNALEEANIVRPSTGKNIGDHVMLS